MIKIPDDVTLTLHHAKIPEITAGNSNGLKYPAIFPSVLGVFQVTLCTMRCAHGSNTEILFEWDPGPTYLVQRLWDPGGPSYTSRSSISPNLEKLGKPKSYLDYILLLQLSSLPLLVILVLNLAPKLHLGKLDHMGSFRYLARLDQ